MRYSYLLRRIAAITMVSCSLNVMIAFGQSNPVALVPDVQVDFVTMVPPFCGRIAIDPVSGAVIYAEIPGNIHEVTFPGGQVKDSVIFTTTDHHVTTVYGMAFHDSTLYLVGNEPIDTIYKFGLVIRGKLLNNGTRVWDTVAVTEYYPAGNTTFDHGFGGIVPTPSGDSLIICSGSRSDHGEEENNGGLFPGVREVPLTSAAFCIAANSKNLVLPADSAALAPYLFADGLRNTFDLAYTPDGDLLGCENSGERDDPEEINWILKGKHYGFPWVMGGNYNPQQYPGYDPDTDIMLNKNRYGYKNGFFHNDPAFPPPPLDLVVTPGISNYGPDADYFRDTTTGIIMQAGDLGIALHSFTAHRSPIGLVFDYEDALAAAYNGDGFMLGYQYEGDSAGNRLSGQTGTILDPSQDLVHLKLEKNSGGDNYNAYAKRIVGGFVRPVDACIIQNVIYVLEYSNKNNMAAIWKVTLPAKETVIDNLNHAKDFVGVYPNPVTDISTVTFYLHKNTAISISLLDVQGKKIKSVATGIFSAGYHEAPLAVHEIAAGIYFLEMKTTTETTIHKTIIE